MRFQLQQEFQADVQRKDTRELCKPYANQSIDKSRMCSHVKHYWLRMCFMADMHLHLPELNVLVNCSGNIWLPVEENPSHNYKAHATGM